MNLDSKPKVDIREPPDGGWGWIVVFGTFGIFMIFTIESHLFGITYKYNFLDTDISSTTIAWIYNTFQFISYLSFLFSGSLCQRFSHQKVAFSAGLLIGVSTILTGFITKPELLFLSFSLFTGIGCGLLYALCQFVVPQYFKKRLGFAMGLAGTGFSLGQFAGPILMEVIQEHYGKQSLFLIGAIELNICVFALLLLPPYWYRMGKFVKRTLQDSSTNSHLQSGAEKVTEAMVPNVLYSSKLPSEPTEVSKDFSIKYNLKTRAVSCKESIIYKEVVSILGNVYDNICLLKMPKVIIITFSTAMWLVCLSNFLMMLPFTITSMGFPSEFSTWCFSVIAIANFIAKLVIPTITDFLPISIKWYAIFGASLMATSFLGFTLATNSSLILVAMAAFGVSMGSTITLHPLIIIEFMGVELLPATFGANGVVTVISFLALGPMIGIIRDYSQSYLVSIRTIAVMCFSTVVLWLFMPLAIKHEKRQRKNNEENNINSAEQAAK